MARYLLSRVAQAIPTLIGVSAIAFFAMRLMGDPAVLVLGDAATPEAIRAYREEHGLNLPVWLQYVEFVGGALRGELGSSYRYRQPVVQLLLERWPTTAQLGLAALGLAIVVGVPVGILSAVRHGRRLDAIIRFFALVGQAIPGFFLGLVLIIIFAVNLRWLPTGGTGGPQHLVLPAVTLGLFLMALVVRFTRSSLLEVLRQDYVRTARAKGLAEPRTVVLHALRNALIPLVTVIGLQISVLFSGAVVTETIFGWPGLGRLAVEAVQTRDFPLLQATILFVSIAVVIVNLIVDLLYALFDPRIGLS